MVGVHDLADTWKKKHLLTLTNYAVVFNGQKFFNFVVQ